MNNSFPSENMNISFKDLFTFALIFAIILVIASWIGSSSDYRDIPNEECIPPTCTGSIF